MKNRKLRKTVKDLYGKGFAKGIFDKLGDGFLSIGSFGSFSAGDTLLYLRMIENAKNGEVKSEYKI